jgi:hypothetical protein
MKPERSKYDFKFRSYPTESTMSLYYKDQSTAA